MATKEKQNTPEPKAPPKILVLRYSSLGDVALTNPVLDGLLAAFPRNRIFFATKTAYVPAIQNHPALERILTLEGSGFFNLWGHIQEIRALNPDMILDLHDSLRTHIVSYLTRKAKFLVYDKEALRRRMLVKKLNNQPSPHTIQKYLEVLEPLGVKSHLKIHFKVFDSKKDESFLREFLERRKISPSQLVIGLGPGARWKTKQWMPERYAELASRLVEDYRCTLLWFGSKDETGLIQSIQAQMRGSFLERGICLADQYSLEKSIALLGRCDLFIGNDSGLTHLASGRGCRVVVIYGSTTTSLGFEPWGPHSVVEVSNLTCRPCDVHGKNACPLGHFKCMKDLTVDLVGGAVKRSVRRSR
jgi:lipopolysaccharide heptosyltransferase II